MLRLPTPLETNARAARKQLEKAGKTARFQVRGDIGLCRHRSIGLGGAGAARPRFLCQAKDEPCMEWR